MRVAFYPPMKPPTDAVPSGDRRMARLLIAALGRAGHGVELACRFSSRDGTGDAARQARLAALGDRLAARLTARLKQRAPDRRPEVWLTYHLYHKAPDHLGPAVAETLDIPYVVAEASSAAKQAGGPWDLGYRAANRAIARADAVLSLNPNDDAGVVAHLSDANRLVRLYPFADTAPFAAVAGERARHRATLAARHGLDAARPWLVVVAMMRPGDKAESYAVLAAALERLGDRPWHLLVAGDGPAREPILAALEAAAPGRTTALGAVDEADLPALLAAGDVYVWPAVREAFGMALVEAQAAGLPVVAGAAGGVPAIVRDGATGLLAPVGDAPALAANVAALLDDPARRAALAAATADWAHTSLDIAGAAATLDATLARVAR